MERERAKRVIGWLSLLVLIAGAFGRAVSAAEPFPWWEADAFAFAPPIVGLTPTPALALNLAIILAAAGVLVSTRGRGPGRGWACGVLLAIGLGVVGWHAIRDAETVSPGSDLAAGVAALVGAWAGSALPGARRVMVGLALGFGVMLAAVGAQETFIEHPRTLESFEAGRADFYRARGWEPDSAEAAMYEERLSHAEPTAWFGLTNVVATFAGASAVGLLAATLGSGPRRVERLLLVAGAVASAWVLLLTGSKGGIGAAALAGLVVAVIWARRRAWTGRAVLAAAVLVVLAVTTRGLVGERIGELSLLFRSQYQRGTVAVWAEHPLVGVGPGNFQDAYTRLKPERASEEVTSPHSVAFDWLGVLGLGGLAWVGLVGIGLVRRGDEVRGDAEAGARPAEPMGADPASRALVRAGVGVVAACVLLSAFVGRAAIAPEGAVALLVGGVGWAVVAGVVCAMRGPVRAAGAGAGAVALVHAQLDVTPVMAVSAPLWGLLVGLLIGALPTEAAASRASGGRLAGWAVGAGAMVTLAVILGARMPALAAWERGLDRAAAWPRMIAAARLDLMVGREAGDAGSMQSLAGRLSGWLGRTVAANPERVASAIDEAVVRSQGEAVGGLREALDARPGHTGTRIALGRVLLTIASRDRGTPGGSAAWDEALASAESGVVLRADDPSAWSWLGTVWEQGANLRPELATDRLERAAAAWERGDRLTPHAPASAARIAEALSRAGREADAAVWAARALARDDWLELDPRRRLSAARRAALEAVGRSGGGGTVPGGDSGSDPGPSAGSHAGSGADVP